jgi:hypothetical protein
MGSMARKDFSKHTGSRTSLGPKTIPTYGRLTFGALLLIIMYFNITLAPLELSSSTWSGQAEPGLFGLCLANICLAVIPLVFLILNKRSKFVAILPVVLIGLTAYAWYASITG